MVALASFVVLSLALGFIYHDGLKELVEIWGVKEEYSYGYMIPFIVLFLIWQKKHILERLQFKGSWAGVLVTLFGVVLFIVGDLSTLYLVVQYSFVVVLAGLVLAFTGWPGFRVVAIPLLVLVFMIPLPEFFLQEISTRLQLVSSQIGVGVIRLFGISVFLEGNVIDLGTLKLQVVEACNGLRYLFPLLTLGFIAAYFFKTVFWKRTVVFLSAIPITVLMNSLRIGAIGAVVEYWGRSMAEGFLHDFEGWAVFMACTGVLVVEMWLLSRFGKDRQLLRQAFGLDFPAPTPPNAAVSYRPLPRPYLVSGLMLLGVAVLAVMVPQRIELTPVRKDFLEFPLALGPWKGKAEPLERFYLDVLKLDDYLLADYADADRNAINLYMAYYASQRKHQSVHSPRTCIPGGGWEIQSLTQRTLDDISVAGQPLRVNRAVIQLGDLKQLTYYWFQERGRVLTNEYLVKWLIFWDAVTRNRTDGALVRLITTVRPGEDVASGDARLKAFAAMLVSRLPAYIPD